MNLHRPLGAAGVAALAVALTACGTTSPGATSGTTPAPSSPPAAEVTGPAPTAAPYPTFPADDYTYVLRVSCSCAGLGAVRVRVLDGRVADATYARSGDPAPRWQRLTIDDVVRQANRAARSGAAEVDVHWRKGAAYPSRVYIDQDPRMADEEVGYTIRKVEVTG